MDKPPPVTPQGPRILSRNTVASGLTNATSGGDSGWRYRLKRWNRKHLNFFRIHLLFFTFVPLFMSIILWATSTQYKLPYVDAVFMSYSALTNTGLQTLDLSRLTAFQQVVLFVQMFCGSSIVISWVVVLVRKRIFVTECEHLVRRNARAGGRFGNLVEKIKNRRATVPPPATDKEREEENAEKGIPKEPPSRRATATGAIKPFRRATIRRVDTQLRLVDPSGRISREPTLKQESMIPDFMPPAPIVESPRSAPLSLADERPLGINVDTKTNGGTPSQSPVIVSSSPTEGDDNVLPVHQDLFMPMTPVPLTATSSRMVGFNVPNLPSANAISPSPSGNGMRQRRTVNLPPRVLSYTEIDIRPRRGATRSQTYKLPPVDDRFVAKHSGIGFGGFPGPIELLRRLFRHIMEKFGDKPLAQRLKSHPSILLPTGQGTATQLARYDTKEVPYFSFAAIVGKNSAFHGLSEDQLEELGGQEYLALKALVWLVPAYYIFIQAMGWIVDGALFSKSEYHPLFLGQWRYVRPSWASVFMGTSAATNTGMSLVDTGLIPFQKEYGVLVITAFAILAGNTAFPILLRFCIWTGTKLVGRNSDAWATLHFLLDHPRRCFLFLFPSHQTWFLATVILILTLIDWVGFLLFDLGNATLNAMPTDLRVLNGFLQATSVRCAGVASVSISAIAPAAQVLFALMMYIAPYPIALAIRSTNVYEDRSLGIYEEEEDSDDEEETEKAFEKDKRAKSVVWGSYLAWHAKRQLAFDIWWIAAAWLIIAAIEISKIQDPATRQFDLFGILFELISAYGSVGLSLGLSNANYSLSGAFTPASKIIMCLVMIRGRHRGLPVAIDRAVMLPKEFKRTDADNTLVEQEQPNGATPLNGQPLETILEKEGK